MGYRECSGECPCDGVPDLDFVMFGYEITAIDQQGVVVYQTMDPTETKGVIPDDMRPLVVEVACACYAAASELQCRLYIQDNLAA